MSVKLPDSGGHQRSKTLKHSLIVKAVGKGLPKATLLLHTARFTRAFLPGPLFQAQTGAAEPTRPCLAGD